MVALLLAGGVPGFDLAPTVSEAIEEARDPTLPRRSRLGRAGGMAEDASLDIDAVRSINGFFGTAGAPFFDPDLSESSVTVVGNEDTLDGSGGGASLPFAIPLNFAPGC